MALVRNQVQLKGSGSTGFAKKKTGLSSSSGSTELSVRIRFKALVSAITTIHCRYEEVPLFIEVTFLILYYTFKIDHIFFGAQISFLRKTVDFTNIQRDLIGPNGECLLTSCFSKHLKKILPNNHFRLNFYCDQIFKKMDSTQMSNFS